MAQSNMARTKHTISQLPLPPPTHILTHALTPDTRVPSVPAFRELLTHPSKVDGQPVGPSLQRRARLLDPASHFSYVAPFPVGFPYAIVPPEDGPPIEDKAIFVETWLSDREATHPVSNATASGNSEQSPSLKLHYPRNREQPRVLIGLSETGLRDCLPHLDVGDAFGRLGTPTLSDAFGDEDLQEGSAEEKAARQELIDVLSGHATLMSAPGDELQYAPWSLRYSGHQFGSWAGQLGDGRAVSLLATPHPSSPNQLNLTYELQLKGAGRTPFSRTADGLAVVRSSIREFLCAEAMHALHIPTTRSLSLISLPALSVYRERVEAACVVCRLAPSFLRIGSFEALNPPKNMFFFGGGQQPAHLDALRLLGEWVAKRVLNLEVGEEGEGSAWGAKLLLEVARRNARMVAGWQAYGFMHGVINTDNVSIMGLTIDYGPYAFMDVFDRMHICNHSDEAGRYAYREQPDMILYALRALHTALAPLIGAEAEAGRALTAGWADGAADEKISEWRQKGIDGLQDELKTTFQAVYDEEYARLMRKRLGLRRHNAKDESELFRPLLSYMEEHKMDFHSFFRKLCYFRPSVLDSSVHVDKPNGTANGSAEPNQSATQSPLEAFLSALLSQTREPTRLDKEKAAKDALGWLDKYAARLRDEFEGWTADSADVDGARRKEMMQANPRFVLRQWVLEEVIKKVEQDADSGRRVLRKVLQMACEPYTNWGAEESEGEGQESQLTPETREERRYCGMGEMKMLGFQCSCSS